MIYKYEIIKNNLYLYLKIKNDLYNYDNNTLINTTNNIIDKNNIIFNGRKVFLIINNLIVKTIDISNNNK